MSCAIPDTGSSVNDRLTCVKKSTLLALSITLLAVAGCGGTPPLEKAHAACKDIGQGDGAPVEMVELASDTKSLTIDSGGGGDLSAFAGFTAASCVLAELNAPSGVGSKMESTTAMMGSQEEDWSGGELTATWTYHPDNGLQVIFEDKS